MNTKLFGAFKTESILQESQVFDFFSISQTSKNYFILNPDFSFTSGQISVNIIGKVFDLKESLSILQIDASLKNPAEAFLIAIEKFGIESIRRFYGEFTFVFISPEKIIVGRDLMGGGPPVFYNNQYFSDKIDSFKRLKGFSYDVDLESIMTFLHLCHIPSPKTAIKDINALAPGDYLIYENEKIKIGTFYDFNDLKNSFQKSNISIDEAVEEYERLVLKSIKRRIDGTKKIGILLSGGFDSASIVHSIRNIYDGEIEGLTIGFNSHPLSETMQAKALADAYKIKYNETNLLGNELNLLPGIVSFLDNPYFEVGLILNYVVMKMAEKFNFDVILGGDGSDEMFGGDIKEVVLHNLSNKLFLNPLHTLYNKFENFRIFQNNSFLYKTQYQNTRLMDPFSFKSFGFNPFEIKRLNKLGINLPEIDYLKGESPEVKSFDDEFLKLYFYKVFRHDGTENVVFKASSMSRMFNNNLTFPFSDIEIYNFLKEISRTYKITGTYSQILNGKYEPKHLQKRYVRSKLPQNINNRKTQGGFIPLSIFFKNPDHQNLIYKIILSSQFTEKFLDKKEVERFIHDFDNQLKNQKSWFWFQQVNAIKLINLLVINLWWDTHITGKEGTQLSDFVK